METLYNVIFTTDNGEEMVIHGVSEENSENIRKAFTSRAFYISTDQLGNVNMFDLSKMSRIQFYRR